MGLFIAKRTERDGVLIAFEGEAMTEAEAERRGLLEKPAKKKAPAKKAKKED